MNVVKFGYHGERREARLTIATRSVDGAVGLWLNIEGHEHIDHLSVDFDAETLAHIVATALTGKPYPRGQSLLEAAQTPVTSGDTEDESPR